MTAPSASALHETLNTIVQAIVADDAVQTAQELNLLRSDMPRLQRALDFAADRVREKILERRANTPNSAALQSI